MSPSISGPPAAPAVTVPYAESSFGYLLHPTIQLPDKNPRIAVIGVGTVYFLKEVASHLPETADLHGFETSIDYPDHSLNLPRNIKLHTANLLLDFPAEYHGTFDVVTVKLLVSTLVGNDWSFVTKSLTKLLKPGGWLQWQEPDSVRNTTVSEDGIKVEKSGLQAFLNGAFTDKSVYDKFDYPLRHLESIFNEAGIYSLVKEVVSSDKQPYLRYNAALLDLHELVLVMKRGNSGKRYTQEELNPGLKRCLEDLESGIYQKYNLLCFIGRK
ncbi:methyltransferase domain-containing protein [Phlyctema vagabunda]|uniref:Methyltransferase domain-containing protein n=1 Tax=Phlyctema vagabunda TaxID=108571 RepID=A0ABR4PAU7_9HELO